MKKHKRPGKRKQNRKTVPNPARGHKDTLFRFIFKDKRKLLELYNALNDTDYQNEEDLVVTTLEDVIYVGYKNDVSFLLDDSFFLGEHQSTWNPNICLRGLLYFARLYNEYVNRNGYDLYGRRRIPLPRPQYYVFYNGEEKYPERTVLRMSDAFQKKCDRSPALECTAVVLNINYGQNRELMERCRPLMEYTRFVHCVREHIASGFTPEAAVGQATDQCMKEGILTDILRQHRKEVVKLFLTEYDPKLHEYWEKKWREEEVAEARVKARAQAIAETTETERLSAIEKLMRKMHLTMEQAMDILEVPEEERKIYEEKLKA